MTQSTSKPVLLLIPDMLNIARIWNSVVPLLPTGVDVRFADVTTQTSIADMARDAGELVADLPPTQRLVVCGFSMGGYVALELVASRLAAQRPAGTWSLCLLNTSSRAETAETRVVREKTIRAMERNFERVIQGVALFNMDKANHPNTEIMTEALSIMRQTGADAAIRQLHAIMARRDLTSLLPQIHAQTLVVSSRSDLVVPPAASEEMAALLPRAQLAWIEGAAHMTPLEQPGQLAALLRTLL